MTLVCSRQASTAAWSDDPTVVTQLISVGLHVAELAHELNNPLSALHNDVAAAVDEVARAEATFSGLQDLSPEIAGALRRLREACGGILESCSRIERLVESLRQFSRREPYRTDVAASVTAAIDWALRITKERRGSADGLEISVQGHLESEPLLAGIEEAALGQVLANLLDNALYAVQQSGRPGVVRVDASPDGKGWLVIKVEDNGCGMGHEELSRLFEPFRTTKPPGAGVGLGLAIASKLVHRAGGRIEATSQAGSGSVFWIHVPAGSLPPDTK